MRCIIKTKDKYYKTYFVELQRNSIVGWFSGEWMRQQLKIPASAIFEIHFTFPKDGNFHHSVKLITESLEQYVTIFWDIVKTKIIVINGKEKSTVKKEYTREEFKDNLLGHLVPLFKADPLDVVPYFHFPTVGFNVFDGSFKIREGIDTIIEQHDIRESDLAVDVSGLDKVSLNISAAIRPNGEVISWTAPSQYWESVIELPKDRKLVLRCSIDPLKDESSAI